MGKQSLYEHSIRVPLIMSGPGVPEGKRTDALCYLVDLYPTICEMLEIEIPESIEGESLTGIVRGRDAAVRDSVFYAYALEQRGIRAGRYKLLTYLVDGTRTTQLFDLQEDPWEMHNLADSADMQSVRRKLEVLLAERMRELDDPCNVSLADWGCQDDALDDAGK
jgi:arylsulfatase A-like enzyme